MPLPPLRTGPLHVGDLIAGRYLLLEAVAARDTAGSTAGSTADSTADSTAGSTAGIEAGIDTAEPAVLWRAHDEVLARAVAVRVVATPNKAARDAAQPFLDAAVRSGRLNHAGLARVYDAAIETRPGRGNDVAYLIREWVDGQPLDQHLADVGALAGPDAADVLRQAADALSAAHAGGLAHGRVHPGNVLVTATGRVRLTDAALASALHGHTVPATLTAQDVRADTRDLAAVLYALVTARWPAASTAQPAGDLPATSAGQVLSPRQVRAGVSKALDEVVLRGLGSGTATPLVTPAALADATDASVAEAKETRAEKTAARRPPSRLRRLWPWAAALAFVGVVGVASYQIGLDIGNLPRRANAVDEVVTATEAPTPGVPAAVALDLAKVAVRDFDPGGDGQENADKVRNALDGFPATTWPTSRYRSATFGGLKDGVGLLLDLGKVTPVRSVQVGFSAPGAKVELRVGDTPPTDAAGLRSVASAGDGKQVVTLKPPGGTRARFLLIWVTSLPKEGDGFRVGISELRIT